METEQPPTEPVTEARPRILIVDDDAAMLKSLSFLLGAKGFVTETAENGIMALEKLEARSYEVMLLDLQMPGMTGEEVLRYVTDRELETKVIVVSGESSFAAVKGTLKEGAYDFVR